MKTSQKDPLSFSYTHINFWGASPEGINSVKTFYLKQKHFYSTIPFQIIFRALVSELRMAKKTLDVNLNCCVQNYTFWLKKNN